MLAIMLRILYNFIKKTFTCDSRMSGVVSRINKCENPDFKIFVNFSCLKNFHLYDMYIYMCVYICVCVYIYIYIYIYI